MVKVHPSHYLYCSWTYLIAVQVTVSKTWANVALEMCHDVSLLFAIVEECIHNDVQHTHKYIYKDAASIRLCIVGLTQANLNLS